MNDEMKTPDPMPTGNDPGWLRLFLILVTAITVALLLTLWLAQTWIFPNEFVPVTLNNVEQQELAHKLSRLNRLQGNIAINTGSPGSPGKVLQPEPYTEAGASREIIFTERELNGLLAQDPDLAHRFAIDLSNDLASGKLLIPLDEEFPVVGGKTLKITAGLEMAYDKGQPVVKLRGVSVWGVPIPNAWLGNLKNVDLVKEFGEEGGFWSTFEEGVAEIKIEEGQLLLRLTE